MSFFILIPTHSLFLFIVVVSKFLERSLVDPKYLYIIWSDISLANIFGLNFRKTFLPKWNKGFSLLIEDLVFSCTLAIWKVRKVTCWHSMAQKDDKFNENGYVVQMERLFMFEALATENEGYLRTASFCYPPILNSWSEKGFICLITLRLILKRGIFTGKRQNSE